ncbi:estradiol 17-beta-dehydrogenase 8 isoform X2 [Eurytemora carolleeae]|uniref:estradiol 17-beta-dehydrogenase 8 isoform X2 n=1 Tax=Eurytemora carolleeae TaxID=1294199 RepID=UPI000C78750B|nr:estradiol 17-beta-dehydrogenase 8 isoform X2 [Eurytemora carolleeae]|eukprot:XP_023329194.1 estradiol 17-beta-dehydrogenase 8-like isoform X2 [Eurytemora affinis]
MASGLTLKEQPGLDAEFTKNRFKDQVVVVTGGGGGIGGAIVYRFLQDGAKVAILDLDENNADSKLAEVGDNLGKNASVAYFGSESLNSTYKDWERTFAVNVMGNAFMTQAVVQYMKNSARKNMSITHISSISAHQAQPNRWTYAASKGAINILTKTMALDLAKWKIRVNSVSPGWIWSPEVAKAANGDREKWEPIWGKFHINGRLGEMSEVAAAVSFLASEDAAFINATDLKVICM